MHLQHINKNVILFLYVVLRIYIYDCKTYTAIEELKKNGNSHVKVFYYC